MSLTHEVRSSSMKCQIQTEKLLSSLRWPGLPFAKVRRPLMSGELLVKLYWSKGGSDNLIRMPPGVLSISFFGWGHRADQKLPEELIYPFMALGLFGIPLEELGQVSRLNLCFLNLPKPFLTNPFWYCLFHCMGFYNFILIYFCHKNVMKINNNNK